MMPSKLLWTVFVSLLVACNSVILPCNESVESKLCLLVNKADEYVPTKSPVGKTVTLVMKINLEWFDFKLNVKRSKEEKEL